jgi:hypothetical protein
VLPERTYTTDEVKYLIELLYDKATRDAYERFAANARRADLSFELDKRLSYEDRVAKEKAEMENSPGSWTRARRERGLPEYTGGPVDWETGVPLDMAAAA